MSHAKRLSTAQARAAMIGLELRPLDDGALRFSYPAFADTGHLCTAPNLDGAELLLIELEAAHAATLAMLREARGMRP